MLSSAKFTLFRLSSILDIGVVSAIVSVNTVF